MAYEWLVAGTLLGRKRRGGGKGDRKAQAQRQAEKRRLAREAARAAAGRPKIKSGRPRVPQKIWDDKSSMTKRTQSQKAPFIRRRLRGKHTQMGVTAFARAAHEAAQAANQAAAVALGQKKEAEQAAAVALEQKKEADVRFADALGYADRLQRCAGRLVPPFLG